MILLRSPVVDIIWSTDKIWAITENHGFRIRFATQIRGLHPLAQIMKIDLHSLPYSYSTPSCLILTPHRLSPLQITDKEFVAPHQQPTLEEAERYRNEAHSHAEKRGKLMEESQTAFSNNVSIWFLLRPILSRLQLITTQDQILWFHRRK